MVPVVSIDEAGNTGANLLDPHQPVFALASVSLQDRDARHLLGNGGQTSEVKFSRLRRTPEGRRRILRAISQLDPSDIKVVLVHKPFMITAKIIDLLLEPMFRANGYDGLSDGSLPALAHLWHHTFDVFLGGGSLSKTHELFIDAVRHTESNEPNAFFAHVESLAESPNGSRIPFLDWLPHADPSDLRSDPYPASLTLDPAVPAVQALVIAWSSQYGTGFRVRHDERNELERLLPVLEPYYDKTRPTQSFTLSGGRTLTVPFPVADFLFATSDSHHAIQLADLVAGASATVGLHLASGVANEFASDLSKSGLIDLLVDGTLWPSLEGLKGDAPTPGEPGALDALSRWAGQPRQD